MESFGLSPFQAHLAHLGQKLWSPSSARIRVRGALTKDDLQRALIQVAEHHEILRTNFPTLTGTNMPVQGIGQELQVCIAEESLGEPHPDAIDEFEEALIHSPFDLEKGPCLRATLIHFSDNEHLLLLVQPALASDSESLWMLTRCLAAALAGEDLPGFGQSGGEDADGDEEADGPLQMADVAQWFNDNFDDEDSQVGLDFWKSLDAGQAQLNLPLAFDRGGDGFHPEACARPWSASDQEALAAFASAQSCQPESLLSALWMLLLARHGECESLTTGMRCMGRAFDGLPEALGPFARFLPVALRIDQHASVAEFARQLESTWSAAEENYETFDYRRAGWNPGEPLAYAAGFMAPLEALELGGRRFELEARRSLGEPFRLFLELDRGVSEPELTLYFNPRYFSGADSAVMLQQFDVMLQAALDDPAQEIGELKLNDQASISSLLEEYAPGNPLEPAQCAVHELFMQQAARHPERIAVRAENGELSYRELDAASNRLAQHLRQLGVGPGSFVGLYLNRCVEQITAIMGVFKAGGAYLPLPPDYPAERIAFMLEDTGAQVVLTASAELSALGSCKGHVICLDDCAALEAASDAPVEATPGMQHDAYVIFTSGSTGKPKGVPITHANLANSTQARLVGYKHPVACYMVLSSFAFDSSVAGLYWALVQGGCLALPPDGFEEDIAGLAALFETYGVTHTLALPSLWDMILDAASSGQLESLNTAIVAGESSSRDLLAKHQAALPDCELVNEYGPTEGTVWSTYFDCLQSFERNSVPIGRPTPGARIFIVGANDRLQPVGFAGELLVAGPGVARGYLGRPELTKERFVTLDLGAGEVRCYRTGDLARFLPGGDIEFLGRIDHQVKIRGYRIELEEIEARLAALDVIKEAVVLAREDTPGDKRLVAYLTAAGELDPKAVRASLAADLPEYMLPSHFVVQASFPLLPNGKVDRKALPAPEQGRSLSSAEFSEPVTPLEKVLVALWSEVLGVDVVGADDDFFELGGHSILATRLFAKLVDTLQASVSLRAIFDARTPRSLAVLMLSDDAEQGRLEATAEVVLEVLLMDDE